MTAAATFCATLVDEWVRLGVRHAVVAPGSRSTPMALALAARDELRVHVVHDERVAAFVALGIGLGGTPAVLLCTSGTAAANLHPAMVEAGLSDVPMLVVTADRPPELRDVGAPQTVDQTHLFGRAVRWFHDPGVADAAAAPTWRSLAARAHAAAADGPVHLNLPFREPLVGEAGELPPAREHVLAPSPGARRASAWPAGLDVQRGVILAGGRSGVPVAEIARLAAATAWPVLADATSSARDLDGSVTTFDALLRHPGFAAAHAPEVVVRIGRPAASRILGEWVTGSGAPIVQVGGPGTIDPTHGVVAECHIGALEGLRGASGTTWTARWKRAEATAAAAIAGVLDALDHVSEPEVARTVAGSVADDVTVVAASSMPIRDLEWYGGRRAFVHANRGANGIDGVMSTALGIGLHTERPVLALVGDIAFVHDSNALAALGARGADLRVVVVDNDGGGIFSFLPQASALPDARFEQLFGTPHGTDVLALAAAHGLAGSTVDTAHDLADAIGKPGPWVVRVATDRQRNREVHAQLNAAVAAALDRRP